MMQLLYGICDSWCDTTRCGRSAISYGTVPGICGIGCWVICQARSFVYAVWEDGGIRTCSVCYGKMPCVTIPSGESSGSSQGDKNLDNTTRSTKLRVPLCSSTVGVHGVWLPDISMSDTFLPSLYISSLHFHTFLKTRVCCLKGLNLLSDGTRPTVWCHRPDQHPPTAFTLVD